MTWSSDIEIEPRNRIRLTVWAYEVHGDPIASDEDLDRLALAIRPDMATEYCLDFFFASEFVPSTGMWVRKHPDQKGV